MGWLEDLHGTLDKRAMPETVARIILDGPLLHEFRADLLLALRRVAASRSPWYVSSMSEDFERSSDCTAQLAAVARMFGLDLEHLSVSPADPESLRRLIDDLGSVMAGGGTTATGRPTGSPGPSGRRPSPSTRTGHPSASTTVTSACCATLRTSGTGWRQRSGCAG